MVSCLPSYLAISLESLDTPSNLPVSAYKNGNGRCFRFPHFPSALSASVFTLSFTYSFVSLLCYYIIIYFQIIFYVPSSFLFPLIHPDRETREREGEIEFSFIFPLFYSDQKTKEREKEKEKDSSSFLFSLFHFFSAFANLLSFSTSRSGDERKKERERVFFFLFSSICLLSFSTSKKRESGREIESFSFIFPPSLPTSYHFPFTWYIQIGRRKRERERERKKNRAALSDERGSLPRVWRISPVSLPFFPQGSQDGDSDRSFERRVRDRIWSFGHLSTSAGGTGIGKHRRFSWKCGGGGIISDTPHVKLTGLTGNGGGWLVRGLFR